MGQQSILTTPSSVHSLFFFFFCLHVNALCVCLVPTEDRSLDGSVIDGSELPRSCPELNPDLLQEHVPLTSEPYKTKISRVEAPDWAGLLHHGVKEGVHEVCPIRLSHMLGPSSVRHWPSLLETSLVAVPALPSL